MFTNLLFATLALLPSTKDPGSPSPDPILLTAAEKSDYRSTSRHQEVLDLMDRLAKRSPLARRASMGSTTEGRAIPLLILADPPVRTAAEALEARAAGKLILFAFGNIHAGEVCGKEALLMLARELVTDPERVDHRLLLERAVLVLAPIYNADGNEDVREDHRPGQVGPAEGMGRRTNAQGLDLNRDHMKLESPEARAHARLLTEWDPDLVIDTHTTNGSTHDYLVTYAAPQNPAAHPAPLEFVRDLMLPEVTRRLEQRTGYRTFFYGNFDRARTMWATYSSQPRFGCPYRGLRNHLAVLSEAYAYATFKDRVLGTLEFVRECLLFSVGHIDRIRQLREQAMADTIALGRTGGDRVGLRHTHAPLEGSVRIASTLGSSRRGQPADQPRIPVEYVVRHYGRFEPTEFVRRPRAYLLPAELAAVVDNLIAHGIEVERLDQPLEQEFEVYQVTAIERAKREFQGHKEVTLEVSSRNERRRLEPGWQRVSLAQPLGTLALYLLEPRSDDGLANWNLLDPWLEVGADYPILRSTDLAGR